MASRGTSAVPTTRSAAPTAWEAPVERFQLATGLQVVLQPDHRSPVVAINLALPFGSGSDPQAASGLAHLCEHLAYAGPSSRHPRAYPGLVQSRGGVPGALTTQDRSHYFEVLPADQIGLGLWIEADRLRSAGSLGRGDSLDREVVDRERRVLLQERAQHVDNPPFGRLYEELFRQLYPPLHPYHRPPMGTPEDLASLRPQDCESYLRSTLTSSAAVLVVTGNFSPPDTRREVESLFGELPAEAALPRPAVPSPVATLGGRRVRRQEEVPFARCLLAFEISGEGHPDTYAGEVLAAALGGATGGDLEEVLVFRRGLARSVSAEVVALRESGALIIDAAAAPGTGPRELEDALVAGVEERLKSPFTRQELDSARAQVLMDRALEVDELSSRSEILARRALRGREGGLEEELETLRAVRVDSLEDIASRLCGPRRQLLVTFEPTEASP